MSPDVLTAHELSIRLVAMSRDIDKAVTEYSRCAMDYAVAKSASELAQAKAYPATEGRVDERAAAVARECSDKVFAELRTEALRNSADRALKAKMAQLSALQSLAAALREELRLARTDNFSPTP